MKRNRILFHCFAIVFLFFFASFSTSNGAEIKWKVQSAFGPGTWDFLCGERLMKRIEEVTGGRLKVTPVMAPGEVVPAFEILDAVEKGLLDAGLSWPGYWVGKNSAFTLFASAAGGPFGMDTWDHTGWMIFGGGYQLWKDLFKEVGYKNVVPFFLKGEFPEPQGWFKKPIKSWADLKGLKVRAAGLAAEVFKEAGMSVVTLPGGEILPALERGVIDGAEYSDPHSDMLLGLHDVCKFYHAPGVHQPTGHVEFLINKKRWDELPKDIQVLIELASNEMMLKNTIEEYVLGQQALQELITKHKVTLVETPDEVLLNVLKAWDKVAERESQKNPLFAKIYNSQKEWASKIVPYRRTFFKDYSFTADYYWPKK
jgi:TRAP-type mannitol/chloroaromatic compound transport system substrate-binding protein